MKTVRDLLNKLLALPLDEWTLDQDPSDEELGDFETDVEEVWILRHKQKPITFTFTSTLPLEEANEQGFSMTRMIAYGEHAIIETDRILSLVLSVYALEYSDDSEDIDTDFTRPYELFESGVRTVQCGRKYFFNIFTCRNGRLSNEDCCRHCARNE